MATQQKQKTRRKVVAKIKKGHRPWSAKTQHDEMVVFPTASGKLATTWMKNVDNIISEGTGDISADKLKVMKGKLQTALDLVSHRLAEEELKNTAKDAEQLKMNVLTTFMRECTGKVVRIRHRERDYKNPIGARSLLISNVEINRNSRIEPTALCIEGLIFDPLGRDQAMHTDNGFLGRMSNHFKEHSRVSQFKLEENIRRINVKSQEDGGFSIEFAEGYCNYAIDIDADPPYPVQTLLTILLEYATMASRSPEAQYLNKNNNAVPEEKKEDEPTCKKKPIKLKLRRKSVKSEP